MTIENVLSESHAAPVIYDFATWARQRRKLGVHISMHEESGPHVNIFLEQEQAERLLAALERGVKALRDSQERSPNA